jgi:hypothetical protein
MPNKYPEKKGWHVPKQKYKLSNWSEYNDALRQRGNIEVWISKDAVEQWYEKDRVYTGEGAPKRYTDFAIIICHEIRQVYRLPLRQTQGFINSLFKILGIDWLYALLRGIAESSKLIDKLKMDHRKALQCSTIIQTPFQFSLHY